MFSYDKRMLLPCTASALHRDLNMRAIHYAREHALLHEVAPGRSPSVLFGEDDRGSHGNFHPASYQAILACANWRERLRKSHTAHRRARPRADWHWRELDCAASSDALLMNVFCHPLVLRSVRVAALLGNSANTWPCFGMHPRLAMARNAVDTTEIDMEWGELLVESKLTETDFQTARPTLLERYCGLAECFYLQDLPRTAAGGYLGYQLVRGVLAAQAWERSFCVLCDVRRTDLIAHWHEVLRAVRSAAIRCRCKLLTWQELAGALPEPLQRFLREKYGIEPAT